MNIFLHEDAEILKIQYETGGAIMLKLLFEIEFGR
jgi:hypothetical protein